MRGAPQMPQRQRAERHAEYEEADDLDGVAVAAADRFDAVHDAEQGRSR